MLLNVSHGKEDMDYTIFNEKKRVFLIEVNQNKTMPHQNLNYVSTL